MNLRARASLWIAVLSIFALVYSAACSSSESTTTTTTAPAAVSEPTATPITTGDVVERTREAEGRPVMTAELIDMVPDMTAEEILNYFPASYPKDFENSDIVKGGIFKLAVTSDISTWDTRVSAAGGTTSIGNCVYERFVQFQQGIGRDPNSPAIVADMAHTWEWNDDGTKLTFHLNDNMYWGDPDDISAQGPKIVASDFVYTVTEYRDNLSLIHI